MNHLQEKFYLSKFKGKVFVIKIGGEVIQSQEILKNILKDIQEIFDLGIRVVLVHGGGPQADHLAKKLGVQPTKVEGRRVTSKDDLEIVKMLYGGSLNLEILSLMHQLGMKGIRVSGLDGHLLDVRKREVKKIDYGYVGEINHVNPQILFDLLEKHYLPVVSPLAVTAEGVIMNINADTIATEIAITLKAEKLVLFTNTDGILKEGRLLSALTPDEGEALIQQGIIHGGMTVKVNNALKAVQNGVKRVHVLNGLSRHSLLREVLTKEGVGTMVVADREWKSYAQELGTEKLPPHTHCFRGKKPGPTVVIVGSAHGNEPIGARVIGLLKKQLTREEIYGTIYLILGNPKGHVVDKRYIDVDLNRQFGAGLEGLLQVPKKSLAYEEKRALEIAPILARADVALDIHSTLKPSVPFLYLKNTPAHLRLASVFGTKYVVSSSPELKRNALHACIDRFVDEQGGVGMTYESGWHREKGKEKEILKKVLRFLQAAGAINRRAVIHHGRHAKTTKTRHLIVYDQWIAKTDHFRFTSDYINFTSLKKGEMIAKDGDEPRKVIRSSFILFPKRDIKKGGIACYLAETE